MNKRRTALLAAALAAPLALGFTVKANAQNPFVSPMFSDNMVLQRNMNDSVWGWTTPGSKVTVQINGTKINTVAGADGKWTAKLPILAVGGPYTLTISGPQDVTFKNILVGDVWLCTGQSNMEFGIGNVTNAAQEIADANYPNMRIFMVPHQISASPQANINTADENTPHYWAPVTPQSIAKGGWNGFSAVGYFFGRQLHQDLKVPIGLIDTDWGGTPAQAWTSEASLRKMKDFNGEIDQIVASRTATDDIATQWKNWYAKNDTGEAANWQTASDSDWSTIAVPGAYQNAGVAELAKFNGLTWFRTSVNVAADDAGKAATLNFVVDDNDTTWVNGQQVGSTNGYMNKRAYVIPAGLLKAGANEIAIRILDTAGLGGITSDAAATNLAITGGQTVPLAGQWHYKIVKALADLTAVPVGAQNNPNASTVLYNGMIAPVQPYGIKGAIWYQGESNAGNAQQYRTLLPTMITDWRDNWKEGNFPFLIVQLAGWQPGGRSWGDLREAQWLTAKNLPNTGIATAIDIGNSSDIHPKDKQDVGHRLALVAEAQVYGKKIPYLGPVYKSMKIDGSSIVISFDHTDNGIQVKGDSLGGYEIAGADGKWVAADAKVVGNTVVVSSALVPAPTAVQYDWDGFPSGNLQNGVFLPAMPFRTNGW